MKRIFSVTIMGIFTAILSSCCTATEEKAWVVDRFDDIKVIRYEVPGFEELPLQEKILIYYLSEAAKCGRDIMFDQNFKYNLAVRRTLEAIYNNYTGCRECEEWKAVETYLKKVWFANGIHHHYSKDKFTPRFSQEYFEQLLAAVDDTDDDTIVYFLHHPQFAEDGKAKPQTVGKMLDNQLCIEGLFPIVLEAKVADGQHVFVTKNDGFNIAKSPEGMFDADTIPNDLKAVDSAIRDYWEMAPLSKSTNKKEGT